ncbi:hypothetical protein CHS0354_010967 [Potamilus streckersoni]|uniref:Steroid 21-hydroxylase n=1 Tax=Potamilus streckersoni TaxID=2493646 RepID=A0AAE0W1Z8_9BIVA|nr:hypothetical protein CHS0354_010967 [Potamilus streckersoni]
MFPMVLDECYIPVILTLLAILLLSLCLQRKQRQGKLPPGPKVWIPLIANALELTEEDIRKPLRRLRKQYGNVYRLYLGTRLSVVICGYEAFREAFVKRGDEFSHRPSMFITDMISQNKGIVCSTGDLWKEHRKFALITLRNFGMGKSVLEEMIHKEVSTLLSSVDKQNQQPFDLSAIVHTSTFNVIAALAFGGHFNHDDPRFVQMLAAMNENMRNLGSSSAVNFFPFLRHLPGDLFKMKKTLQNVDLVEEYINEILDKHVEEYDESKVEDFVSAFIKEMKVQKEQRETSTFTREQLCKVVGDFFVAGTETTAVTILWSTLYLICKPEIQDRMFSEIRNTVGLERLPSVRDKRELVYTEAFLLEIMRHAQVAFLSLPHSVPHDVLFQGYTIPKDTIILPDMDSVLSDPDVWGDPEEFRPERFISKEGALLKPDEFISFFAGRRNCLGESLARMELLLFVSALVQRFRLLPPEGMTMSVEEYDGQFGLNHKPKPFKMRAVPRSVS